MNRDSFIRDITDGAKNSVSTFPEKTRVQREAILLWVTASKCDLGVRFMHVCMLGPDSLRSAACQAPLSMGFSRQEY